MLRHRLPAPLTPDERMRYEREATRLMNACGCEEGAVTALALAAAVGIYAVRGVASWSVLTVAFALGSVLAGFVAGAVVGKLAGLAFARARLRGLSRLLAEGQRARAEREAS